MIEEILHAMEAAVPGLTEGDRISGPPNWIGPMTEATAVWLGGLTFNDVEVVVVREDEHWDLQRLVVTVLTEELVAQSAIAIEPGREDARGRFEGWTLVTYRAIESLEWDRPNAGPRHINRLTAVFTGLPEPLVLPAEVNYDADADRFDSVFQRLRAAWLDRDLP